MFRSSFQSGFLSLFYSIGCKPLQLWDVQTKDGTVEIMTDEDLESSVLTIKGANVSTTSISAPADPSKTLGVTTKLPFLVLLVKNMDAPFSLEVQVIDSKKFKRRFRASTFQSTTRVTPSICTMPLKMEPGWNEIRFDLADFVRRAYSTELVECQRVTINATCRIRRVYFAEKAFKEEDLPAEFKLMVRKGHQAAVGARAKKEAVVGAPVVVKAVEEEQEA